MVCHEASNKFCGKSIADFDSCRFAWCSGESACLCFRSSHDRRRDRPVPDEAFRFGAQAYKFGNKSTAVQALTYAAHNGHMASQWKLGRMYEEGDGVVKGSQAQAFDLFNGIVRRYGDVQPGSVEARYVSNAIVKLSAFVRTGIKGKLAPNPSKARDFLQYAASYFRDPDAQYHLAMSYLDKSDGKIEPKMAARWLSKAARKGHIGGTA